MKRAWAVSILVFSACSSGSSPIDMAGDLSNPGGDAAGAVDMATAVQRGPLEVPLSSDPNGLWWDDATQTLYIADDGMDRVLQWTDAAGVAVAVPTLPTAPQNGPGLGQLVKLTDGTLVIARFGYGTAGDVVFAKGDGTTGTIPGLDVTRRRIGLTVASDGTLYDGYFVKTGSSYVGSVATLTLAGSETEVIGGLQKVVGVIAVADQLFVSDQAQNQVLKAPRAMPSSYAVFSNMIDGPDLLAAGPSGTLFSGSLTGVIYKIASDGTFTSFATGFASTRGVAYDPTNRRLFAAEHDPNGVNHRLHILPVD